MAVAGVASGLHVPGEALLTRRPGPGCALLPLRVEERLAVTAAQQEDEASQVIAQLPGAVGAAADEASR